jgi:ABC-type dipeptide/oligopeptide/nickel transport system ATPase component
MPPDLSRNLAGCPFVPRCEFAQQQCQQPVALQDIAPAHATACLRVQKNEIKL